MRKILIRFCVAFALVFAVDQAIKFAYVAGYGRYEGEYFSLVLTYNKGVAFSMFAFLGEWLKFIQIALIAGAGAYLIFQREILREHAAALGLVLGAGASNVLDRFVHGGVVDYVFWHKWFNFAVFNFADVMIDAGVGIILLQSFLGAKISRAK